MSEHLTAVTVSIGPEPRWYTGMCETCRWYGTRVLSEDEARAEIAEHEAGPVVIPSTSSGRTDA